MTRLFPWLAPADSMHTPVETSLCAQNPVSATNIVAQADGLTNPSTRFTRLWKVLHKCPTLAGAPQASMVCVNVSRKATTDDPNGSDINNQHLLCKTVVEIKENIQQQLTWRHWKQPIRASGSKICDHVAAKEVDKKGNRAFYDLATQAMPSSGLGEFLSDLRQVLSPKLIVFFGANTLASETWRSRGFDIQGNGCTPVASR